ncbi:glyoxalase family protein [Bacillus sp. JCM 19046]|nr:glyoxalase family protein [Bacillus sp. JCM 19045]GAF15766.1 glyoxalase family protein [Bacillus sp. JCM 19046]
MKLVEIHHVSIIVHNLERAKRFYGETLALEELSRPPFDFEGAWYAIGTQQLHLIVQEIKEEAPATIQTRGRHIACKVYHFDRAVQFLQDRGIETIVKKHSTSGFHQVFFTDPDGNTIEWMAEVE